MRLCVVILLLPSPLVADEGNDFFENRIRPLLTEHCLKCHSDRKQQGGLRLDSRPSLLQGGDSGPALVPGSPEKSLLMTVVRRTGDVQMPPNAPLTERQIADLERWIRNGAPWPDARPSLPTTEPARTLWSLQPLRRATPPTIPGTTDLEPIDRFVRAEQLRRNLPHAPPADKRTLLRRLTYDLTGLPPTPQEIHAFLNDPHPGAYERLVDRLLASSAYGERWGRHWLDLVRYCDSFDIRNYRNAADCAEAWRYRDWVVRAFNADLPYDEFIRMQIAGDLLPLPEERRVDGIIATGMLAIGPWGGGDADKEKLITDIVDDQIDVIGRTILGQTLACARCHDHKFDPFTTRDYYGLAGIFFSTRILANVGAKTGDSPTLRIPIETADERRERERLEALRREAVHQRNALLERERTRVQDRLRAELPSYFALAERLRRSETAGLFAILSGRDPELLRGCRELLAIDRIRLFPAAGLLDGLPIWQTTKDAPMLLVNPGLRAVRHRTLTVPALGAVVHPGATSDVVIDWQATRAGVVRWAVELRDADPNCGDGFSYRLVRRRAGNETTVVGRTTADNSGSGRHIRFLRVRTGERLRIVINRRGEHTCDSTAVHSTIRQGKAIHDFARAARREPRPSLSRFASWEVGEIAAPSELPAKVRAALYPATAARPHRLAEAVFAAEGKPFLNEITDLRRFLTPADRRTHAELTERIAELDQTLAGLRRFAVGAQEGGVPGSAYALGFHDARIHLRGRYDRLGETVPRGFPAVLRGSNPPTIHGSGRLALADWLTRPENPLTARVIVNRVWQYHFGAGLVRTPSNFGTLGEPPTHPELLDWLTTAFLADGWSLKRLHRRIVLSATYRQSSQIDAATRAADPENRLLCRMNRRRLEAEALRDGILATTGRLDHHGRDRPAVREFDTPIRTMYLATIRSDRSGFLPLFDGADAAAPTDVRTVSTVAPQALFLLNHPFVTTQARRFAERVRAEAGTVDDRLALAHEIAFGRLPTTDEQAIGRAFLGSKPDDPGVWSAWCRVLLAANEFVIID